MTAVSARDSNWAVAPSPGSRPDPDGSLRRRDPPSPVPVPGLLFGQPELPGRHGQHRDSHKFALPKLRNSSITPPPIRRVGLVDLGGSDDEEMYQYRKQGNDFNPGRNKGWIKVLLPPSVNPVIMFAQSAYGEHHTEEKLVQLAVTTWGVNLATSPTAPPDAGPRIISMYTERRPCDRSNADEFRRGRNAGNCNDFLAGSLNPGVSVGFSVANNNAQHMTLLGRQSLRMIVDSDVAGLRRYAESVFANEFRKGLHYTHSAGDYAACCAAGLDQLLGVAEGILRRSVSAQAVARYNETTREIAEDSLIAQLKIDRFVEEFVRELAEQENARIAEGDRLAAESRRAALFPWEKDAAGF